MRGARRLGTAIAAAGGACAVAGCAVAPPAGPSVMALPTQGKNLNVFQIEDAQCRNYASAAIGYLQPGQAGTQAVGGSATIGTALGAATGAAIGAAAGNAGAGAAIGGATGLLAGAAVGANNAGASDYDLQQRYDIAYTQCMYSNGNTVQAPPGGYAAYAWQYPYWYGYPWYGWAGPGFLGANFFVFRGHHSHHGFIGHGFHGGGRH